MHFIAGLRLNVNYYRWWKIPVLIPTDLSKTIDYVLNFFILNEVEAGQQVAPTLISSQFIYRKEKVHIVIVLSGVLGTGNRDL